MCLANVHPKKYLLFDILGRIIGKLRNGQLRKNLVPSFLRPTWHHSNSNIIIFSYFEKLREILNMHFKDDPVK